MMTATARGEHRLEDAHPWVLDDPFALMLVGPQWRELQELRSTLMREPVRRAARAFVAARSRYTEDRLRDGRFSQYVILGAGLDSFAWRRPDLLDTIRVLEVDHPATQAWKQERAAALALPVSDRHIFAPVDFEVATLRDGLSSAGFDWTQPTLFSWLGVTMYLSTEAIKATLDTVGSCAPGSEVVLTYFMAKEHLDAIGAEFVESMTADLARRGEPFQRSFTPTEAEEIVASCGLKVIDHPTRDDLVDRYFSDRSDDLTPSTHERLIAGEVTR